MSLILVDTGPLYAAADKDDDWHLRTARFFENSRDEFVIPVTVLPEAAYLLAAHLGAEAERKLVHSVVNGEMAVEDKTKLREDCVDSGALHDSEAAFEQALIDEVCCKLAVWTAQRHDGYAFTGKLPEG